MHPDIKLPIAWLAAAVAAEAAGLLLAAPIFAIQIQHVRTLSEALTHFVPNLADLIFIAIILFFPTAALSLPLTLFARQAQRRHWPAWATYAASAAFITIIFVALASKFHKPIPDQLREFNPQVQDVHRPALAPNELPLLAATLTAALTGAYTCRRILASSPASNLH